VAEVQAETGRLAVRAYQSWTSKDIEAVQRDDVPLKDLAIQLKRTYRAVSRMRQRLIADGLMEKPRAGDS